MTRWAVNRLQDRVANDEREGKVSAAQKNAGRLLDKRIFIAAPMSGFDSEEDYAANRKLVLDLSEHLYARHGSEFVYYAGREIETQGDFTPSVSALERDVHQLRIANLFIMIYPARLLSSVILETGCAIGLHIPIIILVKDTDDLLYLIKQASEAAPTRSDILPVIQIYEYAEEAEIPGLVDMALAKLEL